MPPLDLSVRRHTSDFTARKNHPTSYEKSPKYLGPLKLPKTMSTSDNRVRIKHFYQEETNDLEIPKRQLQPLQPSAPTDLILKTIMDHFAMKDAPVDAKEMAESMEFYLRTKRRVIGAAKKRHSKTLRLSKQMSQDKNSKEEELSMAKVLVYDFCSGHGLTGRHSETL